MFFLIYFLPLFLSSALHSAFLNPLQNPKIQVMKSSDNNNNPLREGCCGQSYDKSMEYTCCFSCFFSPRSSFYDTASPLELASHEHCFKLEIVTSLLLMMQDAFFAIMSNYGGYNICFAQTCCPCFDLGMTACALAAFGIHCSCCVCLSCQYVRHKRGMAWAIKKYAKTQSKDVTQQAISDVYLIQKNYLFIGDVGRELLKYDKNNIQGQEYERE